jgi:hypothetical protein
MVRKRKRRKKTTNWQRASRTGTSLKLSFTNLTDQLPTHSTKIAVEAQHGLISQVIKDIIFSMRPRNGTQPATSQLSDAVDNSMTIG